MADGEANYGFIAFQYIHQNPMKAGLVNKMENWIYSSFPDYVGLRKGTICNKELAFEIIGFDKNNFVKESYQVVNENLIPKIFCRS